MTARPLSVLVVDDNPDHADTLTQLLTLSGFQTRVAYGGDEALRSAAADPPDVVVTDLGMPGVDGFEVARRVRDLGGAKRPLVVAITGYGADEARLAASAAGVDLHLVKPADPAVLVGVLERFREILAPPAA